MKKEEQNKPDPKNKFKKLQFYILKNQLQAEKYPSTI